MKKKVALLLSLFWCFSLNAQKQLDTQSLVWFRYYLKLKINDKYQVKQEIEERAYWFPWRQHQFLTRTQLERKLGNSISTNLGFTYFLQASPNDPFVKDYNTAIELRPQVSFEFQQKLNEKFSFNHRYQTEFRFFEQENKNFEFSNIRMRYSLETRYLLSKKMMLKAFDEIHLNVGNKIIQNVFDQNRIGVSFQLMPHENYGVELGYINWFQQTKSGIDFYNRNIIRITLIHNLNLKK